MTNRIKLAEAIEKTYKQFCKKFTVDASTDCWVWNCGTGRGGYGRFYLKSKAVRAHRYSWIYHRGVIPVDMYVLHYCDNPPCVNPDHLFLGTAADNSADMKRKGRSQRGERNGSRTKLTVSDVLDIRASKQYYKTLAERFGVSTSLIYKIKRRECWTHI